ncbi:DUF2442 domain-containing protein [Marinomonas rhodophyticola]|uniref:DUF2442 domain-containing protein n=1 Tax=Marinomonas rhodophyticola TaxID=2992803 RepID=UPI003D16424A
MLHITSAKYLSGYKLWIAFDDGTSGEVDLANEFSKARCSNLLKIWPSFRMSLSIQS